MHKWAFLDFCVVIQYLLSKVSQQLLLIFYHDTNGASHLLSQPQLCRLQANVPKMPFAMFQKCSPLKKIRRLHTKGLPHQRPLLRLLALLKLSLVILKHKQRCSFCFPFTSLSHRRKPPFWQTKNRHWNCASGSCCWNIIIQRNAIIVT